MSDYDYDIGIIGGGSAGLTIAAGAAQFGAKTLLIDKEDKLGGDCLHYGCVPSKTLIKTAHVYHLMNNASKFGLPPHNIRPVDFTDVSKRIKSVIATIQKHDSVERFCGLGVKVEFGSNAVFMNEHVVSLNGKDVSAGNWVVTEIGPAAEFYPAEEYHQRYYKKNPIRYKYYRTSCGRDRRLKELWGSAAGH